MKRKWFAASLLLAMASGSPQVQAALLDRGGGLIFDDILNVTWLQDANYASTQYANSSGTSGDYNGLMDWSRSNAWATNLTYFDTVRNVELRGWRLPTTTDLGLSGCDYGYADTDCGYNVAANSAELAHLFLVDLGNRSAFDTAGNFRSGAGGVDWGLANTGPFKNVQSYNYWSGTQYALSPAQNAWSFSTAGGDQYFNSKHYEMYAWAVRPGDVAAVPEPDTYGMLLAGLGLLAVIRKWQRPMQATD